MKKKFILKPGVHQFAQGSHAVHHNNNLTDEEAEWYLARYPHIAALFEGSPEVGKTESPKEETLAVQEVVEPSTEDITGHFIIQ